GGDPQAGALRNPERRMNPPAIREFSPTQAMQTGVLPVMYLILLAAGAVSLFNAAFIVVYAGGVAATAGAVALAAGLLAGVNGAGRALAMGVSDRIGRCRTLSA